jgi:putative transposase
MHMDVLMATDFLTTEVWTKAGLVTHYVLFFIHLTSRKVHAADMTPHPEERWMVQVVRNVTMTDWGFLAQGQYLIHDRDGTYCPACQRPIDEAGITRVPLPPRSPDLNAYAERWGRSVKEEVLSRRFCRKVRFLGQNPKIGWQEFNDLETPKLSKKQLCDRT